MEEAPYGRGKVQTGTIEGRPGMRQTKQVV